MKTRDVWSCVGLAVIVSALVAIPGGAGELEGDHSEQTTADSARVPRCRDLSGVWIGGTAGGPGTLETWNPLDPSGRRYAASTEWLNFDPTLGGYIPTAERMTALAAEIERTSPMGLSFQSTGYAVDADGVVVYRVLTRGTATLVDCTTMEATGTLAIYGPWQDPFSGDDPPAYGCFPIQVSSTRMPTWAGCDPLP